MRTVSFKQNHIWLLGLILLIVFSIVSGVLVVTQRDIDRDEGFFLEAGRQIADGNLPYHDFMFTQMPLTALISWTSYLIWGNSILAVRFLMLFLLILTHILLYYYSLRRSNSIISSIVISFMSINSTIYLDWCTIVKTYSPSIFFSFSGWLCILIWIELNKGNGSKSKTLINNNSLLLLSGLLISAAVNTRLLMIPFAVIAVIIIFIKSKTGKRTINILFLAVGALISSLPFLFISILDWERTFFFVIGFHTRRNHHQELGGSTAFNDALKQFFTWPQNIILIILGLISFAYLFKKTSTNLKEFSIIKVEFILTLISVLMLFILNLIPNPVHFQYFTVLYPFLFIIALPGIHWGIHSKNTLVKYFIYCLFVIYCLFATPRIIEWSTTYISKQAYSSWNLKNVERVAELIDKVTDKKATVLSYWPGYAYESNRKVPKRWEMGVFGLAFLRYFSKNEAKNFHMPYNYNLPRIVESGEIQAIVCGIDAPKSDIIFLLNKNVMHFKIGQTLVFVL